MTMTLMKRAAIAGSALMLVAMAAPAEAQTYRVGSTSGAPFGLVGFCGEVMAAIAAETGIQIEMAPAFTLTTIMPALTNNEIDIACSALNPSDDLRGAGVAFTSPTYVNRGAIIVRSADTTAYAALAELQGKAVGATNGATVYLNQLAEAGITNVRIYPTNADALNGLVAGEVDAVLQGEPSIRYQQLQGNFPGLRWAETYAPNAPPSYPAIGVRAADTELLGIVQAALQALKGDGRLAEISERWGLAPTPPAL